MRLKACGSNGAGLLSLGHREDVSIFQDIIFHPSIDELVGGNYQIIDLASGSTHTLLLLDTASGERLLLGAGLNTLGQLGSRCALWDDVRAEERFKVVNLLGELGMDYKDWKPVRIAVTWTTSFVVYERIANSIPGSAALQDQQEVEQILLSCGSNDFGELGLPTDDDDNDGRVPITIPSARPTIVDIGLKAGEKVEILKGGQRHVIAVIEGINGQRITGWGAARKGELSPGMKSETSRKGKGKGKGVAQPSILPPTNIQLTMPVDVRIMDIALGASHSVCLLSDGRVLAWGSDAKGQITGLNEMTGIKAIAATWNGCYLLADDRIWSQGSNTHSQLLRKEDTVHMTGAIPIQAGLKIESIVAGTEHMLLLAADGLDKSVWVGGWNEHGNLGLDDQVDRSALTRVEMLGNVMRIWGGCAASWILVDDSVH